MNKKPYLIIAVSIFILFIGVVVGNSYIHKSDKAELNTSINPIEKSTSVDKSKVANKTADEKTGGLRQEDGKTIVTGSLPPQANKLLKNIQQINLDLAEKTSHPKIKDEPKSDTKIADIIAKGNALIAKVDRENGLDTRGFVNSVLNRVPKTSNPKLQELDRKLDDLNAQTKEILRGLQ